MNTASLQQTLSSILYLVRDGVQIYYVNVDCDTLNMPLSFIYRNSAETGWSHCSRFCSAYDDGAAKFQTDLYSIDGVVHYMYPDFGVIN